MIIILYYYIPKKKKYKESFLLLCIDHISMSTIKVTKCKDIILGDIGNTRRANNNKRSVCVTNVKR